MTQNENESLVIDPKQMDNAVLKRLIKEIEVNKTSGNIDAYNRVHNRHNRSASPRPPSYPFPSSVSNKENLSNENY